MSQYLVIRRSPPPRTRPQVLRREVERVAADTAREGRECFGAARADKRPILRIAFQVALLSKGLSALSSCSLANPPPDTRAAPASNYPQKIARRLFLILKLSLHFPNFFPDFSFDLFNLPFDQFGFVARYIPNYFTASFRIIEKNDFYRGYQIFPLVNVPLVLPFFSTKALSMRSLSTSGEISPVFA
ncbi:hypothetical protein KTGMC3_P0529 [Methanocalculus sp. MC3]